MIDFYDPNEPIAGQFFSASGSADPYAHTSLPPSFFAAIDMGASSFERDDGYRYDDQYNYLSMMGVSAEPRAPDEPDLGLANLLDGTIGIDGGYNQLIASDPQKNASGPNRYVWAAGNKLFQIAGLAPGTKVKATIPDPTRPRSPTKMTVTADKSGLATIIFPDSKNLRKSASITIIRGTKILYAYGLSVNGAGPNNTTIALSTKLGFPTRPFGTYVSGYTLFVPSAKDIAATRTAGNWAKKFGHSIINQLFYLMETGEKIGLDLIKHYYATWFHGKELLPVLGRIVDNGNRYKEQTFWAAMDRLNAVIIANSITRFIAKEVLFKTSPALSSIKNLTPSTAALSGFLTLHPEVRGHEPVAVITSDKKTKTYDYSFSTWVRRRIVGLFYSVSGKFAPAVKRALQVATASAHLNFLIDGKNDAYDAAKKAVRGRELQVLPEDCPPLPFLDGQLVDELGTTAGQEVQAIQTAGIAAAIATATEFTILAQNIHFAERNPLTIARRANGSPEHFVELLVQLFTIPGVIITARFGRGRRTGQIIDRQYLRNFFRDEGDQLRDDLTAYVQNPTNQDHYNNVRRHFTTDNRVFLFNLYQELDNDIDIDDIHVINPDDAMRIINTLLVGNPQMQGQQFRTNPWVELATEETNQLREYRQQVEQLRRNQNVPLRNFPAYNTDHLLRLLTYTVADCIP